jgi:hypothetical protein
MAARRRESHTASPEADARSLAGIVNRGAESRLAVQSAIALSAKDDDILRRSLHRYDYRKIVQYRQRCLREFLRLVR